MSYAYSNFPNSIDFSGWEYWENISDEDRQNILDDREWEVKSNKRVSAHLVNCLMDATRAIEDYILKWDQRLNDRLEDLEADFDDKLALKANKVHTHPHTDITDWATEMAKKADKVHKHVHTDITDWTTELNKKSNVGHKHPHTDISDWDTELNKKANTGHKHTHADITDWATELGKYLPLSGGTLNGGLKVKGTFDVSMPTTYAYPGKSDTGRTYAKDTNVTDFLPIKVRRERIDIYKESYSHGGLSDGNSNVVIWADHTKPLELKSSVDMHGCSILDSAKIESREFFSGAGGDWFHIDQGGTITVGPYFSLSAPQVNEGSIKIKAHNITTGTPTHEIDFDRDILNVITPYLQIKDSAKNQRVQVNTNIVKLRYDANSYIEMTKNGVTIVGLKVLQVPTLHVGRIEGTPELSLRADSYTFNGVGDEELLTLSNSKLLLDGNVDAVIGGALRVGTSLQVDADSTFRGIVRVQNDLKSHAIFPEADSTYDIGKETAYYNNLYVNAITASDQLEINSPTYVSGDLTSTDIIESYSKVVTPVVSVGDYIEISDYTLVSADGWGVDPEEGSVYFAASDRDGLMSAADKRKLDSIQSGTLLSITEAQLNTLFGKTGGNSTPTQTPVNDLSSVRSSEIDKLFA